MVRKKKKKTDQTDPLSSPLLSPFLALLSPLTVIRTNPSNSTCSSSSGGSSSSDVSGGSPSARLSPHARSTAVGLLGAAAFSARTRSLATCACSDHDGPQSAASQSWSCAQHAAEVGGGMVDVRLCACASRPLQHGA